MTSCMYSKKSYSGDETYCCQLNHGHTGQHITYMGEINSGSGWYYDIGRAQRDYINSHSGDFTRWLESNFPKETK